MYVKCTFIYLVQLYVCVSNQVVGRAELLFSEVLNALLLAKKKSGNSMIVPESRHHITDLEGMLQKEKSEFEVWIKFQILIYVAQLAYIVGA